MQQELNKSPYPHVNCANDLTNALMKRAEFKGFERKTIGANAIRAGIMMQPKRNWLRFIPGLGRKLVPQVGDRHWRAINLEFEAIGRDYDTASMTPRFDVNKKENTIEIEFKAKYHGR